MFSLRPRTYLALCMSRRHRSSKIAGFRFPNDKRQAGLRGSETFILDFRSETDRKSLAGSEPRNVLPLQTLTDWLAVCCCYSCMQLVMTSRGLKGKKSDRLSFVESTCHFLSVSLSLHGDIGDPVGGGKREWWLSAIPCFQTPLPYIF